MTNEFKRLKKNKPLTKKPYTSPQLQTHGPLHRHTQGSAIGVNDANGSTNTGAKP
jgi:hypothetical protein